MPSPGSATAFPTPATVLTRQRLIDALSSLAPFVVLVGPVGAGASTLLRQWASSRPSVAWASAEVIPDTTADVLIIDQADAVDSAGWDRIHALRRVRPQLLIRAAAHSRRALPPEVKAEFIDGLPFTMQETSEYLATLASHLDHRAVHHATDGLPAAVEAIAHLNTTRSAIVDDALADLCPGPLQAQHALLAIPGVLTRELVRDLGGPTDFIDDAERAGHGHWTADSGHPLFRLTAPVRAATAKAHPSADRQTVRVHAGRELLAQGAWYGALIEGAATGELSLVDGALRGGGMSLLQMHGASIGAMLRGIQVWELRHWPIIAMAQALIYNARHEHRMRAIELMGIALIGARSTPTGSAERGLLRIVESVLQRLLGVGDGGVKAALAGSRILRELPADGSQSIAGLLGDLHTHAAVSLMSGGRYSDALVEFERGRAKASRPGLELLSFGGIAMINTRSGDLIAGKNWVDIALKRPWPESILNDYAGCMLRIAQAKLFVENGELDRADEAIDRVWPIIDTVEFWPLLAHMRALIDICRGRADGGLERFRTLRSGRGSRISRTYSRLLDLTDSSLALAIGDLDAARKLTSRAGDGAPVTIGVVRSAVFDGHYERALRMLGSITVESPEDRANTAVLEAIVLHRLGRAADAALAARRAVTIAGAYGLTTPFLLIPTDDRDLFDTDARWQAPGISAGKGTPRLTERERVVLRELVGTASVNEIAKRLHVSANTVKSQRRTLYRKLDATSREEALAAALGHGLLADSVS